MKLMRFAVWVLFLAVWLGSMKSEGAVGPAFTYQGLLTANGGAANGTFDLRFALFHTNETGVQIGNAVTNSNVPISNGVFTVVLDFGAPVFNGTNLWLEIAARSSGAGAFSTMAPRQALLATPYAIRANNSDVASGVTAGSITSVSLATGAVTADKIAPGAISQLGAPDGTPLDAVRVNTNGLVGIGTNAPVAGLHIAASAPVSVFQRIFQVVDGTGSFTNLGGCFEVAVRGDLMAVGARDDDTVLLVDITDRANPNIVSEIRHGEGAFTNMAGPAFVAFSGNNLIISAGFSSAINIVSVSDPVNPIKLAELKDGVSPWLDISNCQGIAVSGSTLAIASQDDNAVTLVDISNPAAPVHRSTMRNLQFGFNHLYTPFRLSVAGNLLAVTGLETNAVTLIDITDPTNPQRRFEFVDGVGGYDGLLYTIAATLDGNRLAIVGALDYTVTLVDVSAPASPVRLAVLSDFESLIGPPVGVAISGNRMVVGGLSGLTLFDISVPTAPKLLTVQGDNQLGFALEGVASPLFLGTNIIAPAVIEHTLSFLAVGAAPAALTTEGFVAIGTSFAVAPLTVSGDVVVQNAEHFSISARHVSLGQGDASGLYATAMGKSVASGEYSVAMGNGAKATSPNSVAMGSFTTASGDAATAMGSSTTASGPAATALGNGTVASGLASVAIGFESVAAGSYSFAGGIQARANESASFVWSGNGGGFTSTGPAQFLIEGGGGVGIRTNNPNGAALNVRGTVHASGDVTINSGAGTDLVVSETGLNRSASSNTTFAIQNSGSGTMNLTVDGNLGVGTNNATSRLQVVGAANISSSLTLGGLMSVGSSNFVATAGATINPAASFIILSAASAVALGATAIADGSPAGTILILQGTSDANTVTVNDGANTLLGANRVLGANDTLTLIYNGAFWVEIAFAAN